MVETALHIAIRSLEAIGAIIIVGAAGMALFDLARAGVRQMFRDGIEPVRLQFAQRLVLALEFLIAADILATLHAPTLEGAALLGAIIAVRTVLSLSIAYELRHSFAPEAHPRQEDR